MPFEIPESDYPTFEIVRDPRGPEPVEGDAGPGLAEPFIIKPDTEPEDGIFALVGHKYETQLIKINRHPGVSLLCIAAVTGRSLDAIERLDLSINELLALLNAARDPGYRQVLYPKTERWQP